MNNRVTAQLSHRLRKLCAKSYATERLWQHRKLHRQRAGSRGSIIVHQMSKVGSQTVVASLKKALPEHIVFHTHFLSEAGLGWLGQYVKDHWGEGHIPMHLWHGQYVRKNLLPDTNERLKIVTLVRDPVSRSISEFFQELDVHMQYPYGERMAEAGLDAVADELERLLLLKLTREVDWSRPYAWFDREIRDELGIDVFAFDFDTSAGFGVMSTARADILLIKLERLSECCQEAFTALLGGDGFTLARSNEASNKYYSEAYGKILDGLVVPPDSLEQCYASAQVRHFYNDREIAGFIDRWHRTSR